MARELPKVGGVYMQAESEVAAINMVYGAAGAGARVMTSSSSPGISLMQEGISYIAGAELPCVAGERHARRPGARRRAAVAGGLFPGDEGRRPRRLPRDRARPGRSAGGRRTDPAGLRPGRHVPQSRDGAGGRHDRPADGARGAVAGARGARTCPPRTGRRPGTAAQRRAPARHQFALPVSRPARGPRPRDLPEIRRDRAQRGPLRAPGCDDADVVIVAYGTTARIARSAVAQCRRLGLRVGPAPADHALSVSRTPRSTRSASAPGPSWWWR